MANKPLIFATTLSLVLLGTAGCAAPGAEPAPVLTQRTTGFLALADANGLIASSGVAQGTLAGKCSAADSTGQYCDLRWDENTDSNNSSVPYVTSVFTTCGRGVLSWGGSLEDLSDSTPVSGLSGGSYAVTEEGGAQLTWDAPTPWVEAGHVADTKTCIVVIGTHNTDGTHGDPGPLKDLVASIASKVDGNAKSWTRP